MLPGEVLLTPAWCWHGHANETSETGYWIDFLDIPFIQLTEAMFFEPYPQGGLRGDHQHRGDADADSLARRAWAEAATRRRSRSPRA